MSSMALDRIRRCLAMVPLIRARPGIRIGELASMFGVTEREIRADIAEVLSLCGVPPYLPHNYLVLPSEVAGLFGLPPEDRLFYLALLAVALPFIAAGVLLTVRRLRDAGLPTPLVLLFFVPLVNLLFGGEWPGTEIISRLYAVHVVLIPAAIVALLAVHLIVLVRQKHTQFPGPGRTEHNVVGLRVWPGFAMKSIGLFFLTAGVLTGLGAVFHINAVWQIEFTAEAVIARL